MLYYAGKLVQFLIAPLNIVLLLLAFAWLFRRRGARSARLLLAGLLLLLTASLPAVAHGLMGVLESEYPILPVVDLPEADAIVLLGGTVVSLQPPRVEAEEMAGARVQRALRLFRAGKAPVIVCSGGNPYRGPDGEVRSESDDMRDLLVDLGVPESAVRREAESRNTNENARYSAALLRELSAKKILLVTSAFHMRRAAALFRREGFDVIAAPSDPRAVSSPWRWNAWMPGPDSLRMTTQAINEIVGYYGYRLLGQL